MSAAGANLPFHILHIDHPMVNGRGLLPRPLLAAVGVVMVDLLEESPGEDVGTTGQL